MPCAHETDIRSWREAQWLKHLLLLHKTQVWVPAPTLRPVALVLGVPICSAGLPRHCMHMVHTQIHRYSHKDMQVFTYNIKINKIFRKLKICVHGGWRDDSDVKTIGYSFRGP